MIYSCRHAFSTNLGGNGCDASTLQKLAGHSSITMSQKYVHPTPARLETAIGLLESKDEDRTRVKPWSHFSGTCADVAELADAKDLGSFASNGLQVRLLSSAPYQTPRLRI